MKMSLIVNSKKMPNLNSVDEIPEENDAGKKEISLELCLAFIRIQNFISKHNQTAGFAEDNEEAILGFNSELQNFIQNPALGKPDLPELSVFMQNQSGEISRYAGEILLPRFQSAFHDPKAAFLKIQTFWIEGLQTLSLQLPEGLPRYSIPEDEIDWMKRTGEIMNDDKI